MLKALRRYLRQESPSDYIDRLLRAARLERLRCQEEEAIARNHKEFYDERIVRLESEKNRLTPSELGQ